LWGLGSVVFGSGCAGDLPISERIVGLRTLAMRVEVVDPLAVEGEAIRSEALPIENIRVLPFIVDPEGPLSAERIEAEIEPIWLACPLQPIQGIFGCLSSRLPLALDDIEDCPPVDFSALDPESGELPTIPTPCLIAGGRPAEPLMQVPIDFNFFLGGDLEITMIGHRPEAGSSTTTSCADDLLAERHLASDCLFAVQRASIGPDAAILKLAADAGLPELDQLGPIPSDDEIPDADRHPRIQSFRVVVTDEEDLRRADLERVLAEGPLIDVARGDTITVSAGQTLLIETIAPVEDLQTYLIPTDDSKFEERDELYIGDWFRTWGTLLGNDSDDPRSFNTWAMIPGEQDELDTNLPPEGRATLFYVLRDDRQGVSWWWFHVEVEP